MSTVELALFPKTLLIHVKTLLLETILLPFNLHFLRIFDRYGTSAPFS